MKIADVAEFYSEQGGGVRTYIHQKFEACREHGHELTVVAPGASTYVEQRPGGQIAWVKAPRIPVDHRYHIFVSAREAFEALDHFAPDIVEGSSTWKGGWIAAKWPGPAVKSLILHQDPVAVYPHTLLEHWISIQNIDRGFGWFWRYLKSLGRNFDTSIVAGDWLADRFAAFGMARPHVVPFGVNKADFSPDFASPKRRQEMLSACGIEDPDAKLLVAVSRHHPEKRLGLLLKAFDQVRQSRTVGLYLIGDGPTRRWVEKAAAKVAGVHVAGPIKDRPLLAQSMASADAMLHGGAAETFGLVVAEALCAGLPLIVPDRGGAADLAGEAYAVSYKTGDLEGCRSAIHEMLDRDLPGMHRAARDAADQKVVTMATHFDRLFDHYGSLLDNKAGGSG